MGKVHISSVYHISHSTAIKLYPITSTFGKHDHESHLFLSHPIVSHTSNSAGRTAHPHQHLVSEAKEDYNTVTATQDGDKKLVFRH